MRPSRLAACGALVYGAVLFLPTLGSSFYRDDFGWVERALAAARDPARWPLIAGTDFRPLASLSFMANLAVSGIDPAGYHAFNVILHLGNVLLLMALVRRLGGDGRAAAIAGFLFAGATFNYGEAVVWICGRTGPIADFFMLATLIAHWDWRERGRARDRVRSLACFALALLSKESASVLLPLLLLLEWVRAGGGERPPLRRLAGWFAPHALLLAAYLVFQFAFWRRGSPILENEYLLGVHAATNLAEYLVRLFIPVSPTSMFVALPRALVPLLEGIDAVLGIALPLTLVGLLAGRAPRATKYALWWILLTLLPVVFFTYRTSPRYLYAPSMGVAMALGLSGARWWARNAAAGARQRLRPAAVAFVALLLVQGSVMQVIIRRHAAMERAEGAEPWARLRAVANLYRPASTEAP